MAVASCTDDCTLYSYKMIHTSPTGIVTTELQLPNVWSTYNLINRFPFNTGDANGDGVDDVLAGGETIDDPPGVARAVWFPGGAGAIGEQAWSWSPSHTDWEMLVVDWLGDIDGDGFDDLAVAEQGLNTIHIFVGGPAGPSDLPVQTFQIPDGFGGFGFSMQSVPDLTGDGRHDLLVAAGTDWREPATLLLYAGRVGGFEPDPVWSSALTGRDMLLWGRMPASVGDVDGDTQADLVAHVLTDGRPAWGVFLGGDQGLPADPDGELEVDGPDTGIVAIADLDDDATDDVVLGLSLARVVAWGQGSVQIWHGKPGGPAGAEDQRLLGMSVGSEFGRQVAVLDANEDGAPDIFVADFDYGRVLSPQEVAERTSVSDRHQRWTAAAPVDSAKSGDVNGDGKIDLVFQHKDGTRVHLAGETSFDPTPWRTDGGLWNVVGDVDGDGAADLAQGLENRVYEWRPATDLRREVDLPPPPVPGIPEVRVEPVGDIDGDGFDEAIAVRTEDWNVATIPSSWVLLRGGPDGLSVWQVGGPPPDLEDGWSWMTVRAGDVNGDGRSDLVTATVRPARAPLPHRADLALYLGTAEGLDIVPTWQTDLGDASLSFVLDVDGDGLEDIVTRAYSRELGRSAAWYRSTCDGLDESAPLAAAPWTQVRAYGDMDGDGDEDLLARRADITRRMDDLGLDLLSAGRDGIGAAVALGCSDDLSLLDKVGDVDGDGRADVLSVSGGQDVVLDVWLDAGGRLGPSAPADRAPCLMDPVVEDPAPISDDEVGCGCTVGGAPLFGALWVVLLLPLRRRSARSS